MKLKYDPEMIKCMYVDVIERMRELGSNESARQLKMDISYVVRLKNIENDVTGERTIPSEKQIVKLYRILFGLEATKNIMKEYQETYNETSKK